MGWIASSNAPGNGWGADLGFTYEFRPDIADFKYSVDGKTYLNDRKNKYKFRLSASLLDLGNVKYRHASNPLDRWAVVGRPAITIIHHRWLTDAIAHTIWDKIGLMHWLTSHQGSFIGCNGLDHNGETA